MHFIPSVPRQMIPGLLGVLLLLGCRGAESGPSADVTTSAPEHDPDDVPITEADVKMPASYAEAIPRLKIYREVIRSSVEAGTPHKAHRPLDELDIVLNKLAPIARDSGIPKDYWETVNVTARELRHLFDKIHSAIDDGRTPDYAAIATDIDQAI